TGAPHPGTATTLEADRRLALVTARAARGAGIYATGLATGSLAGGCASRFEVMASGRAADCEEGLAGGCAEGRPADLRGARTAGGRPGGSTVGLRVVARAPGARGGARGGGVAAGLR